MKFFKVSLSGDLGSGKSTVCSILTEKLNLQRISVGGIQREEAKKRGMTIEQFNRYMETNPEIDRQLDEAIGKYEKIDGNFIFDSRLAWHFVPSSVSVYLKVDTLVAAQRIFNAERQDEKFSSIEQTLESIVARRKSEVKRYENLYGLKLDDDNNYDCVIDTTNLTPQQVADLIIKAVQKGKIK